MCGLDDNVANWLKENYHQLSLKECAKELMVSVSTIKNWSHQLGLRKYKPSLGKDRKLPLKVEKPKMSEDIDYCRHCKHYCAGGLCGKTGRYTGSLNEKQCFKRNKK